MKQPIVTIERISNFEFSFAKSTKIGLKHVGKALSFKNPDPYAAKKYSEMFDKRIYTFKIGMLSVLEAYLKENDITYDLYNYEYTLPTGTVIDSRMSGKYDHQSEAVEAFFEKRFGIIVVPTRGGKTFIASEIIRIFNNNNPTDKFLFIVDTDVLFSQAVGDIKEFFEPYGGIEIGEIRAGRIDTNHLVTVAMIQTVQQAVSTRCKDKAKKKKMLEYLKHLKFLCIDEIHDNCSDTRLSIYKKCHKIDYLLCLSATPYRANSFIQNLKLQAWSGGIVYTIKESTLRDRKVLSDYKVFMLLLDHNQVDYGAEMEDNTDYNEYRKKIIFENVIRNNALFHVIDILKRLNLKTLILFQSIEHGKKISKASGIKFIHGGTKTEEREEAKNNFLKESGGFLLASGIFKKGVTVSEVEVLINVDGGLEDANTIQKKGRVLGTTATKDRSLIIDFFDVYSLYFSEHSETRLNTYIKAIGEDEVGILDTSVDDCFPTLERWIAKWFRI